MAASSQAVVGRFGKYYELVYRRQFTGFKSSVDFETNLN